MPLVFLWDDQYTYYSNPVWFADVQVGVIQRVYESEREPLEPSRPAAFFVSVEAIAREEESKQHHQNRTALTVRQRRLQQAIVHVLLCKSEHESEYEGNKKFLRKHLQCQHVRTTVAKLATVTQKQQPVTDRYPVN